MVMALIKAGRRADRHPALTLFHATLLTPRSMKLEKVLWSKRPAKFALTVFTQLTLDRLNMLSNQCRSFQGPISAALHLSLVQQDPTRMSEGNQKKLAAAINNVTRFFEQ